MVHRGGFPKGRKMTEEHKRKISEGRRRFCEQQRMAAAKSCPRPKPTSKPTSKPKPFYQEDVHLIALVRRLGEAFGHALGVNLGNAFSQGLRLARSQRM